MEISFFNECPIKKGTGLLCSCNSDSRCLFLKNYKYLNERALVGLGIMAANEIFRSLSSVLHGALFSGHLPRYNIKIISLNGNYQGPCGVIWEILCLIGIAQSAVK